ncbi:PDR/VanB family oxidoreductase [Lichenihabitans psoromatis]|uniref:PDR/VanB family oxidoreductase n=1 Tax=Lichenihabitans psoromatis TaxID=2528642 RepID=UPI001036C9BB
MSDKAPRIAVTVADVVAVTPFIKRFRFEPLDPGPLPTFSGGAHVVVEMQDGDLVRRNAYSLMSPPSETSHYTISVRRDESGRGGSRFLHDHVRPGMTLHITHPVNLFPIDHRAKKHLLIAGGIGITPFLAMAEQLAHNHTPFELHYAFRSRDHAAYADDLETRFGTRVHLYHGDRGEAPPLDRLLPQQPLGTHLYVCGPAAMIDWVLGSARAAGWPDHNLHHERFIAPAIGTPYEVRLARAAVTVRVGSHQSMLEAIEAAGVDAPSMCRGGACGQCETTVLSCEGTLLHADHFLTDTEKASNTRVMPCVSRFEGQRLVLDL